MFLKKIIIILCLSFIYSDDLDSKDIINNAKGSIEKLLKFTNNNERVGLANDA